MSRLLAIVPLLLGARASLAATSDDVVVVVAKPVSAAEARRFQRRFARPRLRPTLVPRVMRWSRGFYRGAENNPFSDHLFSEMHAGFADEAGQPALGSFITEDPNVRIGHARRSLHREIAATFQAREDKPLTPFGRVVADAIRGRDFIDLGSGIPEVSYVPRLLAVTYGASSYLGVDSQYIRSHARRAQRDLGFGGDFPLRFKRQDFFLYLAHLSPEGGPRLFHLAGIESEDTNKETIREQASGLATALANAARPGDLVLSGHASYALTEAMRADPHFRIVAESEGTQRTGRLEMGELPSQTLFERR